MIKKKLPTNIKKCNTEMELAQKQIRQYGNRKKITIKKRNHRCIVWYGYLESVVLEFAAMKGENVKTFLRLPCTTRAQGSFLKNEPKNRPANYEYQVVKIEKRCRKYDNKFNPRNKGEVLTYVYLLMS